MANQFKLTRRQALKLGGAGVGMLAAPALVGKAFGSSTVPFKIGHTEAVGSPINQAIQKWADTLNSVSGGAIDAQNFPAGQLGKLTELIENSRIGVVQATTAGPDMEETVAPEIAVLGGAPGFIYQSEAHVDAVLQGDLGRKASDIARAKTGVEFVAYGETGFRHILSNDPIENLEDLAGTKLRVPPLNVWLTFWQALGANPTPLAYSEQYQALSAGVIEGLESDYFSVLGFKWHEIAKHVTKSYHWFLPKAIRVNAAWLDSLPAELADLVRKTAQEAFAEQRANNRANVGVALDNLVEAGVTVHELSDDERARWMGKTEFMFDDLGKDNPETAAMIKEIRSLA